MFNIFEEDATLHNGLNNFVKNLIYNSFTDNLFDATFLNALDREELGEQFTNSYVLEYKPDCRPEQMEMYKNQLSVYAAKEIDRLIPFFYFMELNTELSSRYTPLLTRRIYETKGKDSFQCTADFEYKYDHDFNAHRELLKKSSATDKQISLLKDLGKKIGYLLWHEEYLSKTHASQLIEYLSEKNVQEPIVFSYFFVSK